MPSAPLHTTYGIKAIANEHQEDIKSLHVAASVINNNVCGRCPHRIIDDTLNNYSMSVVAASFAASKRCCIVYVGLLVSVKKNNIGGRRQPLNRFLKSIFTPYYGFGRRDII